MGIAVKTCLMSVRRPPGDNNLHCQPTKWELWLGFCKARRTFRSESPNNPGERSRLWCPYDIHDVLIGEKVTRKIEVIVFNYSPMKNVKYNTKAFKNMENLRVLEIDEVHLDGKFKHLSSSKVLICLQWNHCPLKYINIPSSGFFEKLVSLKMGYSNIKEFKAPLKRVNVHSSHEDSSLRSKNCKLSCE
ncbi:PREDICTED: protein SUPPRESSOR OF npr1-1, CONSTITUTIVE 1-like [Ipomoea nil]|uniref:protein SUPPRESSOR OF npr1-1, CONSTITUTIVE 1-like n=1 Tax=Ipomoea nil TaxID=35883 RepID=UPI000900C039|nr:PREDICTED: protein SUPPRESSOR OF npr1-1, CONSTITUTIVE 1-like [Ipomoea nil]